MKKLIDLQAANCAGSNYDFEVIVCFKNNVYLHLFNKQRLCVAENDDLVVLESSDSISTIIPGEDYKEIKLKVRKKRGNCNGKN